jgi:AcrR family transcriptional regulator
MPFFLVCFFTASEGTYDNLWEICELSVKEYQKRPSLGGTKKRVRPKNMAAASLPPSPWAKLRDRAEERKIKREAVLRTAGRLFTEKGFHATSLDEVAERLNVTKPTLYYYWKNKDEILFECVRTSLQMLHSEVEAAGASGGKPLDKLEAAMRSYINIVTQDFGLCVIRVGEDPLPPESRKKIRGLKAQIDLEFRRVIMESIQDGSIAPCDPKMAAFAIGGALSWIGRWYQVDGAYTPEEIANHFIPMLLQGLVRGGNRPPRRAKPKI